MRKDPGHTGESIISFCFHHLGKLRVQSPGANQGHSKNYHCVSPLKTGARIGAINKAFIQKQNLNNKSKFSNYSDSYQLDHFWAHTQRTPNPTREVLRQPL